MLIYGLFALILKLCLISGDLLPKRVTRQIANPCSTPDNQQGNCIVIQSCPVLRSLLTTRGREPPITDFLRQSRCGDDVRGQPRVCCPSNSTPPLPSPTSTPSQTIPQPNPPPSSQQNYSVCGKSNNNAIRIVGGQNSTFGNWPWIAAVGYRRGVSVYTEYKCGGSLISDRWVVTAGHCVVGLEYNLKLTLVRLGDLHLDDDVNDGASPVDISVDRTEVHPNYTRSPITNDVALLHLENPVTFTPNIRPICILNGDQFLSDNFYNNLELYITGWGAIVQGGSTVNMLQEAAVKPVGTDDCQRNYDAIRSAVIDDRILCAAGDRKDSCQGDSGGPLMLGTRNLFYLVGIVSYGYGCGLQNYPGVYTRVARFAGWITQTAGL